MPAEPPVRILDTSALIEFKRTTCRSRSRWQPRAHA